MEFINKNYDSPQYAPRNQGEWKKYLSYQVNDYVELRGDYYLALKDAPAGSGDPELTPDIWTDYTPEIYATMNDVSEMSQQLERRLAKPDIYIAVYDETISNANELLDFCQRKSSYGRGVTETYNKGLDKDNVEELRGIINKDISKVLQGYENYNLHLILVIGKDSALEGCMAELVSSYASGEVIFLPTLTYRQNASVTDNILMMIKEAKEAGAKVYLSSLFASVGGNFDNDVVTILEGNDFETSISATPSCEGNAGTGTLTYIGSGRVRLNAEVKSEILDSTTGENTRQITVQCPFSFTKIDKELCGYATSSVSLLEDQTVARRIILTSDSNTQYNAIRVVEFWDTDVKNTYVTWNISIDFSLI